MDAKVVFWTGAWLNFSLLFGLALLGMRRIRSGDAATHRRLMLAASALVVFFLLSYVAKLWWLGREDMSVWSARDVNMLRFHETCVLVMVVGGGIALWLGRRLRRTRNVSGDREQPAASPRLLRSHRVAGRLAVIGAALGWLSAFFVLVGMFERADESLVDASFAPAQAVVASGAEAAHAR